MALTLLLLSVLVSNVHGHGAMVFPVPIACILILAYCLVHYLLVTPLHPPRISLIEHILVTLRCGLDETDVLASHSYTRSLTGLSCFGPI